MASPTAKVKVVLEVGAKLRGQASLETFIAVSYTHLRAHET